MSGKIGRQIEKRIKEYLERIAITPKEDFLILEKDLRLMKSGRQFGRDLNWKLRFNIGGRDYKWHFESKGAGRNEYLKRKRLKNFKLNIISDKLLQLLGRTDLNVDCWCLFAPYIRLDPTDQEEIEKIQNHLPFKLCFWDKDFLFPRIRKIHAELFKNLYGKDKIAKQYKSSKHDARCDDYIWEIFEACIEGFFRRNTHAEYQTSKRSIEERTKRELVFCKNPERGYFFQYQKTNFYVDKQHLSNTITKACSMSTGNISLEDMNIKDNPKQHKAKGDYHINDLVNIFSNALSESGKISLYNELQSYLRDKEIPFAQFTIVFKIKDFSEIKFSKIDSSIYFGTSQSKNILFKQVHGYPYEK